LTRVYVQIFGAKAAETRFTRMAEAAINAEPAMLTVAAYLREVIATTFRSQGRRGGGSWKRDDPWWAMYKQTLPGYGGDPRIGFFTGDLYRSYTDEGGSGNILEIGPHHVNVGSDLEYAEAFNRLRPIRLTAGDRLRIRTIIRDYLLNAWRTGAVGVKD